MPTPAVNGQVVGLPALQASSSISSLAPAAAIDGSIGLTATAGSFCLFCENGDGGLPTVTFVSLPGGVAAATATGISTATETSSAARSSRFISPLSS